MHTCTFIKNICNGFRDWRIVLCFAPCSIQILWAARRDFWGRQEVVQGELGQAGWRQRGQSTLFPAWARALREPGACSNSSQPATVAALKTREWFWEAASEVLPPFLPHWNIKCNFLPGRGKGILGFYKLGSSQQTGWWPQLLLSNVLHEGLRWQHWEWGVLNWVIFIRK